MDDTNAALGIESNDISGGVYVDRERERPETPETEAESSDQRMGIEQPGSQSAAASSNEIGVVCEGEAVVTGTHNVGDHGNTVCTPTGENARDNETELSRPSVTESLENSEPGCSSVQAVPPVSAAHDLNPGFLVKAEQSLKYDESTNTSGSNIKYSINTKSVDSDVKNNEETNNVDQRLNTDEETASLDSIIKTCEKTNCLDTNMKTVENQNILNKDIKTGESTDSVVHDPNANSDENINSDAREQSVQNATQASITPYEQSRDTDENACTAVHDRSTESAKKNNTAANGPYSEYDINTNIILCEKSEKAGVNTNTIVHEPNEGSGGHTSPNSHEAKTKWDENTSDVAHELNTRSTVVPGPNTHDDISTNTSAKAAESIYEQDMNRLAFIEDAEFAHYEMDPQVLLKQSQELLDELSHIDIEPGSSYLEDGDFEFTAIKSYDAEQTWEPKDDASSYSLSRQMKVEPDYSKFNNIVHIGDERTEYKYANLNSQLSFTEQAIALDKGGCFDPEEFKRMIDPVHSDTSSSLVAHNFYKKKQRKREASDQTTATTRHDSVQISELKGNNLMECSERAQGDTRSIKSDMTVEGSPSAGSKPEAGLGQGECPKQTDIVLRSIEDSSGKGADDGEAVNGEVLSNKITENMSTPVNGNVSHQSADIAMVGPAADVTMDAEDEGEGLVLDLLPHGLSDTHLFLSASASVAVSTVASYKDERSVALATEMASQVAPPDMPLQPAPTILTTVTTPIASIPDLNTLKCSPTSSNASEGRGKAGEGAGDGVAEGGGGAEKEETKVDETTEEFVWEDYLEATGAQPVPPHSFSHVNRSVENSFEKGQLVEISAGLSVEEQDAPYWLAEIVLPCGQLLGLRYLDDSYSGGKNNEEEDEEGIDLRCDLWKDAFQPGVHPLGWCAENDKKLVPPKAVERRIKDVEGLVRTAVRSGPTPPGYLFKHKCGTAPVDFIQPGLLLEAQEELLPGRAWPVRVIENVGGRLLLRYEGAQHATHDFWLFYLNHRLHPLGWGKQNAVPYETPAVLQNQDEAPVEWNDVLDKCFAEAERTDLPPTVFQDHVITEHSFKEGMKLEALHPQMRCAICPATVYKIISQQYFIIAIDDMKEDEEKQIKMCCHGDSAQIFPVRWCVRNGLRLQPPNGWKKPDFDWKEYLIETKSEAVPEKCFNLKVPEHDFSRGFKLEAANPDQPGQICAATITRIVDHLLWIHLDNTTEVVANHIVPMQSHDLFPIGWCESNNYPLKPPRTVSMKRRYSKGCIGMSPMTADEYRSSTFSIMQKGEGSCFCPKIFFNHRCFSGAFLSKARVAELPASVGPGPVLLVIKEVLRMLINAGYKSSRVLRELQLVGAPNPHMHQQVLKAKYKGKSYKAVVEICSSNEQIEEFCRQTCIKLECCPLLISPYQITDQCPENCSQLTKTKYTAQYLGKSKPKKIGRPPGGHSNMEGYMPKKRGRKRKRGRKKKSELSENMGFALHPGNGDAESVSGSVASSERMDEEVEHILLRNDGYDVDGASAAKKHKRKYDRKVLPPTEIKTRGVKLPSYSHAMYERRKRKFKDENDDIPESLKLHLPLTKKHSGEKTTPSSPESSPFDLIYGSNGVCTFKNEVKLRLESNPLYWSVQEVVDFIKTTDSAQFARILKEQEIDGQALLLLSLPTVQEYLDYKLGPAVKLCHHVERIKLAFYEQFT